MSDTNDISQLKGKELYEASYDLMNLLVSQGKLTSRLELGKAVGKYKDRVYERYIPWLKKEHPGDFENIEGVMDYVKQTGMVRDAMPKMDELIKGAVTPEKIADMFKAELASQIKGNMATKVKLLLDSMENDLLVTRKVTLQACMLAITGYFNSIQKRVAEGKEIYTKEFKYAYDVYKTEMGEPLTIKETRTKNMQVTLQVPISKEDVNKILGNKIQHDLSIECADEFRDQLNEKFNINQHIVDGEIGGDPAEAGDDRATTEAEEVPGEHAV